VLRAFFVFFVSSWFKYLSQCCLVRPKSHDSYRDFRYSTSASFSSSVNPRLK
jgi:hypothetical protein